MRPRIACLLVFSALLLPLQGYCQSVDTQLSELKEVIGGYPPKIDSDAERVQVRAKYLSVKETLDQQIKSSKDAKLILQRAHLQSMGHNLDEVGAFEGARRDYLSVLKLDQNDKAAWIGMGELLVNAEGKFASVAEQTFRMAQQLNGQEPLEAAQRGIFFALYYQAKVPEALKQAEFLVQQWPTNSMYRQLFEQTQLVLSRGQKTR